MIYIHMGDGAYMLVLEPNNISAMKAGHPVQTPDEKFLVCFTPDALFVEEKLKEAAGERTLTGRDIDEIIRSAAERREVHR
jgi:hypothetical protein